jgi:uncharacterized protein (DUF3084 family)
MKNLILFITFFLISLTAFSQDYPKIEKDSLGNQIVIMTLEQAQALDNNTDLLVLFEKLNTDISNFDSVCVKVINEKDEVINQQTIQISNLKKALNNKDDQILNLQKTVDEKDKSILILEKVIVNKDQEINLHLGEIKRVKKKSLIGGLAGGTSIIGLIIALIVIN